MPTKEAGIRIEPPPSVPRCSAPAPVAAQTAAPPLEPPGVIASFQGLTVTPESGESVTAFQPSSGVVVRPRNTAPALRNPATDGASQGATTGALARLP